MKDLPQTWATCRLGDVVDYGAARKAEPEAIPVDAWVLELEDIEKDTSKVLHRLTFAQRQSKSTKNRFAAGDVLYGKLRPYLNKVVRADQDGFCTTEIIPLPPSHSLDGGYLFYWLKHPVFLEYVTAVSHGLNMPRLGTEAGRKAPFVLAPINEQKRIADKLYTVLARVDACRERLNRMPAILKRFRQTVLVAATCGGLTEDWRNVNGPTFGEWSPIALGKLVIESANGLSKRTGVAGLETIVLRLSDFKNSRRLNGNERAIRLEINEFKKYRLGVGDILVVRVNGSRDLAGRLIDYIPPSGITEAYCDHFIRLRLDQSRIDPKFALYVANSGEWRAHIERELVTSAGQNTINQKALFALELVLPPLAEQHEIIRRVEALFAYADRLEARYAAARAQVERLTPALLAMAFRGELVPQDPNDEPGSVLLERIRAARAAAPAKPRRGRSNLVAPNAPTAGPT